ncbi:MAG: hypothetical protein ACYS9X_27690 [Planctomycetota bacterium]
MSPREKLEAAYEIAFFPPRLHGIWRKIKEERVEDMNGLVELLKMALALHQALPESGYSSQRALKRLAVYQANARAFGTVTFLRNILRRLGEEAEFPAGTVPPGMVRDIGLPEFTHHRPGAGA